MGKFEFCVYQATLLCRAVDLYTQKSPHVKLDPVPMAVFETEGHLYFGGRLGTRTMLVVEIVPYKL